MRAQVIRPERYGAPITAFLEEEVPEPTPGPGQVKVRVRAAGVNYNGVWAARGFPVDVIAQRAREGDHTGFHIAGSEAAGVVAETGPGVRQPQVGDEVVVHGGAWNPADPLVAAGGDAMLAPTARAWGYETNYGSFAQYCLVFAHQCLPKPTGLSWEEAAAYMLSGATAFRMLRHWKPHQVSDGDTVLVWGGAGGLGVMAIQLAEIFGGRAIAIVSSEERALLCKQLGATGTLNRSLHAEAFGRTPGAAEEARRAFSEEFIRTSGSRARIVLEHSGETTLPLSQALCESEGMIVICAGTSGYLAALSEPDFSRRGLRLQGSHFANQQNCVETNELVRDGRLRPVLSRTFEFSETGLAHQMIAENKHPPGNMAILVP